MFIYKCPECGKEVEYDAAECEHCESELTWKDEEEALVDENDDITVISIDRMNILREPIGPITAFASVSFMGGLVVVDGYMVKDFDNKGPMVFEPQRFDKKNGKWRSIARVNKNMRDDLKKVVMNRYIELKKEAGLKRMAMKGKNEIN